MTDDEMRITIAEACGWVWWMFTDRREKPFYVLALSTADWPLTHGREGKRCERPILNVDDCDWTGSPDYLNDLNAMAQAEATLSDVPHEEFARILWPPQVPVRKAISAPARQRAEAFLKTIGKWKE